MKGKASTPPADEGAKSPLEQQGKEGGEGRELTAKEKEFVRQYMVDLNATKAAIRAGYSKKSARQIGSENLSKPYIAKEISLALEDRCGVTVARVVDELAKVGFSDIRKVVSWRPEVVAEPVHAEGDIVTKVLQSRVLVKDSAEIDDDTAAAIESVSQGAQGQLRVRMHDKPAALEKLARALGMFRDRHAHVGPDGKPLPVAPGIVIIETSAVPTTPKATSRPPRSRNVARARRRSDSRAESD
jgi:phage terminase small subunit